METAEILREIKMLPLDKRLIIVELTLKSIREAESKKRMKRAAEALFIDYADDKELTALTALDFEIFYETR